jgi:hypothetical protein
MMAVVIGGAPMVALGLFAWWARARPSKLEIVNLCAEAPASKRSKRTAPIDAVVLHQMSLSRGDDLLRYKKVTAHFVIAPNGAVAQLHPLSARLSASHGFNGRSVSIEFAGNLQSVDGHWWRPDDYGRNYLTPAQVEAGRRLLKLLRTLGVRFVFAHRQSYAERQNDPGPEIWSRVGEWAIAELAMSDGGPGYFIDTGHPIPEEWRSYEPPATGNA